MFKLTITSRDYIPFTINGNETDLLTACMVMSSGLQMRQRISVTVSSNNGSTTINELRNAAQLTAAVTDCISFLNSRHGGEK
jgi:hypothetical protein